MEIQLENAIQAGAVTVRLLRDLMENHRLIYMYYFNEILYAVVDQKDIELVNLLFSVPCGTKDQIMAQIFRFAAYKGNDFMVDWIITWYDEQQETVALLDEVYVCGLYSPSDIAYLWVKNRAEALVAHAAAFLAAATKMRPIKKTKTVARYRDLGLGAQLLQAAIINKWMSTIKKFADDLQLVRKVCLADGGAVLRRVWKKKSVVRVLLSMGVSRSDCASVGLSWAVTE